MCADLVDQRELALVFPSEGGGKGLVGASSTRTTLPRRANADSPLRPRQRLLTARAFMAGVLRRLWLVPSTAARRRP